MAKIARRKLSKEAIKNKQKTKWWTKTKIIITSVIAFIAVACAVIGTVLHFTLSDEETASHDYFVSAENASGDTVEFTKASYRGLQMVIDDTNDLFEEYVIVFMYDSTKFYPNQTDDSDNYVKEHSDILLRMANLQTDVNAVNAKGTFDVSLYIVDLSIGDNASIVTDSTFLGDSAASDETSVTFAISLIKSGEVLTTFDDEDKSKTIVGTSANTVCVTALPNLSKYVQNLAL